uniref:C3H1-type domain-containing protein n=1 Tax=Ananas comosus var. bracteatus TaxID=296719 RepID=A0A6V7PNZ5_ANACO|nr:unnamed protein product [Ananas comosus var. bracteatus]
MPCSDFRKGACRRGDMCEYAHGVFECWLHPASTHPYLQGRPACTRRICFFAHAPDELRPLFISTGSAVPSPRSSDMPPASPSSSSSLPSAGMPPLLLPAPAKAAEEEEEDDEIGDSRAVFFVRMRRGFLGAEVEAEEPAPRLAVVHEDVYIESFTADQLYGDYRGAALSVAAVIHRLLLPCLAGALFLHPHIQQTPLFGCSTTYQPRIVADLVIALLIAKVRFLRESFGPDITMILHNFGHYCFTAYMFALGLEMDPLTVFESPGSDTIIGYVSMLSTVVVGALFSSVLVESRNAKNAYGGEMQNADLLYLNSRLGLIAGLANTASPSSLVSPPNSKSPTLA